MAVELCLWNHFRIVLCVIDAYLDSAFGDVKSLPKKIDILAKGSLFLNDNPKKTDSYYKGRLGHQILTQDLLGISKDISQNNFTILKVHHIKWSHSKLQHDQEAVR